MKKSPGKILVLLMLLFSGSFAAPLADYSLKADKREVFEREAVVVTFTARQLDHTDNMMFLLKPRTSSDYKIVLLNKAIDDKKYHDSKTVFTYVLFPLHPGTIRVGFDFTVQTASDKAIAQSYVDDHDDSIAIQTTNTRVDVPPLSIRVKAFDRNVDLVGDFRLEEKINKTQISRYESVSLVYTLSGTGYGDASVQPLHSLEGVTMFAETSDVYSRITKGGYAVKRRYIYALSAKKDFTVPAVSLQAYSPRRHEYYSLKTDAHPVKVTPIDTAELLDKREAPASEPLVGAESIRHFFIYLALFLMGYASAKLAPMQRFTFKKQKRFVDIKTARNPKKLLAVLLKSYDRERFADEIAALEGMVYKKRPANGFNTLKKEILERLEEDA